jgi:hypothetical protein
MIGFVDNDAFMLDKIKFKNDFGAHSFTGSK